MHGILKLQFMQSAPWFKLLDGALAEDIVLACRNMLCCPGDVIIEEGMVRLCLCFLWILLIIF